MLYNVFKVKGREVLVVIALLVMMLGLVVIFAMSYYAAYILVGALFICLFIGIDYMMTPKDDDKK